MNIGSCRAGSLSVARAVTLETVAHHHMDSRRKALSLLGMLTTLLMAMLFVSGQASAELRPLSGVEMSGVAGQGVENDQREIQAQNSSLNGLTNVVQTAFPVLGFIQSETSVSGVRYAEGVQPLEINLADGSITINLPEYIENVTLGNLRPQGAAANGPSFGTVQIQGLSFSNSSITIRTKP